MELILNLVSKAESAQPLMPRQLPAIHTLPPARCHSKEPNKAHAPIGQGVQLRELVTFANVPAEHNLQVMKPGWSWNVPGSQDVQLVDPSPAANVPGAHMLQVHWCAHVAGPLA
jgi:hypothetical protein